MASKDNLIRCLRAVQAFGDTVLPCTEQIVKAWHRNKLLTLKPCVTPATCKTLNGKPKLGKGWCQPCVDWSATLEAEWYPPSATSFVGWKNIDSSLLHGSPVEAAKGFVVNLPKTGHGRTTFGDFGALSLIKLMMSFQALIKGDATVYSKIQKVCHNLD